ncbi:Protein of unknown function [Gryllus bimaculatus]|nr:Protein of unknown function [Gryllus bimaculatus]
MQFTIPVVLLLLALLVNKHVKKLVIHLSVFEEAFATFEEVISERNNIPFLPFQAQSVQIYVVYSTNFVYWRGNKKKLICKL